MPSESGLPSNVAYILAGGVHMNVDGPIVRLLLSDQGEIRGAFAITTEKLREAAELLLTHLATGDKQ